MTEKKTTANTAIQSRSLTDEDEDDFIELDEALEDNDEE